MSHVFPVLFLHTIYQPGRAASGNRRNLLQHLFCCHNDWTEDIPDRAAPFHGTWSNKNDLSMNNNKRQMKNYKKRPKQKPLPGLLIQSVSGQQVMGAYGLLSLSIISSNLSKNYYLIDVT
jgi:hypothetical protein|tara:strand:- start:136 stop:495 length:360 start_codon:yes stop_codon:yes gene_type:complete